MKSLRYASPFVLALLSSACVVRTGPGFGPPMPGAASSSTTGPAPDRVAVGVSTSHEGNHSTQGTPAIPPPPPGAPHDLSCDDAISIAMKYAADHQMGPMHSQNCHQEKAGEVIEVFLKGDGHGESSHLKMRIGAHDGRVLDVKADEKDKGEKHDEKHGHGKGHDHDDD